jgi:vacuolar-type H+-ATPase subunit F/Vma7
MKAALPVVYVGEELAAAGFRLAGADARVPEPGRESACLAEARSQAAVVLLGAGVAARIPEETLAAALTAASPLVLIVPEEGAHEKRDPAKKTRRLLGAAV